MSTLINESLSPGVYEVEWNAEIYPSGVYFYTFEVNDFRESKRMLYIK